MTAQEIITRALGDAGNTGLSSADALRALNIFLQAEYRRKYFWQRKTITLTLAAGQLADTADWDATYLDVYEQQDESCGRFVVPNSPTPGYLAKTWAMDYRQYIAKADRLSATGPPRYIIPDEITATWYVWPVPDQGYTISVDIYTLPADITLTQAPLWSSYAPDEILVQVVKVWALEYMQDDRFVMEKRLLFGDAKSEIPGMLPTYRRRLAAREARVHQTALDQRVFPAMSGFSDDRMNAWD